MLVLHIIEIGDIQTARLAVVVSDGRAFEDRQKSRHSRAGDLIHHIVPEHAAGIRETSFLRVEHQTGVFERRAGQDDESGFHFHRILRETFDVSDSTGLVLVVHQNVADYRIAANGDVFGSERGRQSDGDGVEHRAHVAAVDAVATVMAGRAVVQHRGELGNAPLCGRKADLLTSRLEHGFGAVQVHRRKEFPVRELWQAQPPTRR